jgi:hypothetical protein
MRRPVWFEPINSAGEWIGFLGGLAVVCGIVVVVATGVVNLRTLIPSEACIRQSETCMASVYRVRNDTAAPVILRECDGRCAAGDYRHRRRIRVAPGELTAKSVDQVVAYFPFITLHVRDWWEVRAPNGRLLGCLVLAGHGRRGQNNIVRVSAAGPCGKDARATPPLPG